MIKSIQLLFTFLITVFFTQSIWAEDAALHIMRITPEGENVPTGQQIVITFDQPVVALSDMKRTAEQLPISVEPSLDCQWRWLDTQSLACQLKAGNSLSPASRYTLTIKPGITTVTGAGMNTTVEHSFTTETPDIRSSWFRTWLTPGTPVIQTEFNLPVSRSSVEQHVYFYAGEQRFALKVEADPDAHEDNTQPDTHQYWLLSPRQPLPIDVPVQLMIEPGVISSTGPVPGNTERSIVAFHSFPDFNFLGIRCYSTDQGKQVMITGRSADPICDPLSPVYMVFSAPVAYQMIQHQMSISPDLAAGRKDYDPWASYSFYSKLEQPHQQDQTYELWFPESLKAFQKYQLISRNLLDEFGRPLSMPVDFSFMTSHRQPNIDFSHQTAVLEKNVDSQMPVYATNINTLSIDYSKMTTAGVEHKLRRELAMPDVTDIAFAHPMPIRDMLDQQSGVIFGMVDIDPEPKHFRPYELFSQVTPWQVQAKLGHFNSLFWVLDMATGEPVADASISLFSGRYDLTGHEKPMEQAHTNDQGLAEMAGLLTFDPELSQLHNWGYDQPHLMIRVEKGQDMALLPLDDNFSVWDNHIYPWNRNEYGYIKAWGTTAQGVYRPGDTIQYKLYVRDQDNQTLISPPTAIWKLTITDPTDKTIEEINDLQLNEFGAYAGEVAIPKNASVGWYRFKLSATFGPVSTAYADADSDADDQTQQPAFSSEPISVLVSDFTPAPFRVSTELNGDQFRPGDELVISTSARLHAGGPYTQAQTRISADLTASEFHSEHPQATGFTFSTYNRDTQDTVTLLQKQELLNDQGDLETRLTLPDKNIIYGTMRVESSVQDDRGKSVAKLAQAKYIARDRLVGLKNTRWVYEEDQDAAIEYLVVDEQGQPLVGVPVEARLERLETHASRVRSAGNAYLTEYISDWIEAGRCAGTSTTTPAICHFTPDQPGDYRICATIMDSKGREHRTEISAWVVGKGQVLWEQPTQNNLSIIAENTQPKIGDKVRYLIKNPYPGGKALITIERYGLLKSWTEEFTDSTEIIEFPVEPDYMPGFYLSVTVFSPRVDQPLSDGNVDLGKPAFSMGYVNVPVTDPYKQIDVTISTSQETYKPGENVQLSLSASPRNDPNDQDIELAVVVLDEAVFDLIKQGERYFDPYQGFYSLENLDVANFSLITRLIGRQKFEKKGANPGGDGGTDVNFRSIENYVGYWNPSIILPPGQEKSIAFRAPDNLTGWRVFAMAVNKGDRLGLGKGQFKVNKALELRPVMPNQVLQSDQFKAGFSVMNRTDETQAIDVTIQASGSATDVTSTHKTVNLDPFKRDTIWLPIQTRQPGEISLTATASATTRSGVERDALRYTLPVLRRDVTQTAASYGSFSHGAETTTVQFPDAIHTDSGELSVIVSPTVIGNVDGAFRYMRDYPYSCWEQRLSKGVMADQFNSLQGYLPADLLWPQSTDLVNDLLTSVSKFQAPNGGMSFWIPDDEYVSPYLSAYTALAFGWLKDSGHVIPGQIEAALHGYLETLLRRDVLPSFYDRGMASTVRAVALAALAQQGRINKDTVLRYRDHVPQMSLFGKAHYLLAASKVQDADEIMTDVTRDILSHSVQSAGKFQFNEAFSGDYQRILETPMRTQCAVLSALIATAKKISTTPEGQRLLEDVPFKLVRAITQRRGKRDHWENTQENLFCMNALRDYQNAYEQAAPDMTVRALLDQELLGSARFKDRRDQQQQFDHPINAQDPGRKSTVSIEKQGTGRLYYTTRLRYAPLEAAAESTHAGIEIRREYSIRREDRWELLSSPMQIKRGDLVRVDLYLDLPTARHFVVVDDPVPGGLEPVNRDLATASILDAEAGDFQAAGGSYWFEQDDWLNYGYSRWSFYHQELRHDSVRFYSDYLSAGHYHLSYTAQAIAAGEFSVQPAHSEEMYDPDVYGTGLPASLIVTDQ